MLKYPLVPKAYKRVKMRQGPNMKISIIFLEIYLLSVACSPNLNYSTNAPMGVAVESNSAEEG